MGENTPAPLEFSLPRGEKLRFILVPIVKNSKSLFGTHACNLGSHARPEEPVTRVSISGTLYANDSWYIPFCETEITRAQYAAVMNSPAPSPKEANLPQTMVTPTQVQIFLSKLNSLVLPPTKDVKTVFPCAEKNFSRDFYFRLPSAVEWEFAARGGHAVAQDVFDADTYYGSKPALHYEHLFRSGRQVQRAVPVKGRRKSNPLGLYDMLGNVEEWVSPLYRFDGIQGRTGGALTCGACFRTPIAEARASRRMEYPPYSADTGGEIRGEHIGFRPVIGSVICHKGISPLAFRDACSEFRDTLADDNGSDPTMTSDEKLAKIQAAFEKERGEFTRRIEELTRSAQDSGAAREAALKTARVLEKQMSEYRLIVKESQRRSADAALNMISTSCIHIAQYAFNISKLEEGRRVNPADEATWTALIRENENNINGARYLLSKGCRLLADVPVDIADEEISRHKATLLGVRSHPAQADLLQIGLNHAANVRKTAKTTLPDDFIPSLLKAFSRFKH